MARRRAWLGLVERRQSLLRSGAGPARSRHRRKRTGRAWDPRREIRDDLPSRSAVRARIRRRPRYHSGGRRKTQLPGTASARRALFAARLIQRFSAKSTPTARLYSRPPANSIPTRSLASWEACLAKRHTTERVAARVQFLEDIAAKPREQPLAIRACELLFRLPAQPLDASSRRPGRRRRHRLPHHGDAPDRFRPRVFAPHADGRRRRDRGSAWRRSSNTSTCSRTSATGRFSTPASSPCNALVASGLNITYKILYNGHVSMTGGQDAVGALPVPQLTKKLEAEGVRRTIILTEDRSRYQYVELASNAEAARSLGTGAYPRRAGQRKRRDRDDLRPGVRGGGPPQALPREIRRARQAPHDPRRGLRRLRRLRQAVQLHEPQPGRDRRWARRCAFTSRPATRIIRARSAIARRSSP